MKFNKNNAGQQEELIKGLEGQRQDLLLTQSGEQVTKLYTEQFVVENSEVSMTTSEQDAILEGTRHPVDDESPVVAERGEEPGVGRRPLGGVHAVLVLFVRGHHAVFQRLLSPAKKRKRKKKVEY